MRCSCDAAQIYQKAKRRSVMVEPQSALVASKYKAIILLRLAVLASHKGLIER